MLSLGLQSGDCFAGIALIQLRICMAFSPPGHGLPIENDMVVDLNQRLHEFIRVRDSAG